MRKIIGIIFFCFCCCIAAMAQDEPENNDTLSLTDITTTDILQTLQTGKIKWTAVTTTTYQAKWCFFGKCADDNLGITHIVESCCTFGQWIRKLFGGGKGSTTTLTQNTDSGGGTSGTGGGGNSSNTGGGSGSIPPGPTTPPIGTTGGTTNTPPGYGTTPTNTFTTTITTPPPIKPATVLDNGDMEEDSTATVRKDTVKPVEVNCDSTKKAADILTTKLWDSLMKLPEMQKMQDTALHGVGEMALSAYDSSGHIKTFRVASWNDTTGFNSTTPLLTADTSTITDTSYKRKNVILQAHTHNEGIDAYPEPHDLYELLHRRLACNAFYCYPKEFNYSFFLCGDTAINLALNISDTSSAIAYINKYRRNKAVVFDTLLDGTRNPAWSNTYTGEFQDQSKPQDSIPLGVEFIKYEEFLRGKNYPEKLLATYAQVCMLASRNVGVTIKMQVDGKFKELSAEIIRNSVTGKLESVIIKICN